VAPSNADLAVELQKIYDSEINISIGWFWDGGITLRLGDEMNGFPAEETVRFAVCPSRTRFLARSIM